LICKITLLKKNINEKNKFSAYLADWRTDWMTDRPLQ